MQTKKEAPAGTEANTLNEHAHFTLCSGIGQFHSDNARLNAKPYIETSIAEIIAMAKSPQQVDKGAAQWVIPSTLPTREVRLQREQGLYLMAWQDYDDAEGLSFYQLIEKLSQALPFSTIAFTSRSATEGNQKCRVMFPLDHEVTGLEFELLQEILNDKAESVGLKPDRVTETANQLCYLPNRGEFYQHFIDMEQPFLSLNDVGNEYTEKLRQQEQAAEERKARIQRSKERSIERAKAGELSPVNAFKSAYLLADYMPQLGYKQAGKDRFLSPYSESGSAAVNLVDNGSKWVSHHGSDMARKVGAISADGKTVFGDAFDLFVHFECNGDYDKAVIAAGKVFTTPSGQSITSANQQKQQESANPEAVAAMFSDEEASAGDIVEPSPTDVDINNPPGLAGDICRLMQLKARRLRQELYPFAALHLMALIGRKRKSVFTSKLNLITLGIAETAAGKETAQGELKKLANSFRSSRYIHGNSGSFKDMIYNLIEGDGASLYIVDEIHSFLGAMKSDKAQSYESKMEAEILVMSSTELYTFRGIEKRDLLNKQYKDIEKLEKKLATADLEESAKLERALERVQRVIQYLKDGWPDPFFSIMGHSVPDRLDSFTTPENIASGFIGRTLIRRCPERREKLRRKPVDSAEVDRVIGAIEWGLKQLQASGGVIDVEPEAEAYLNECVDWYDDDEQLNHHIVGGVYARAPEQLYKVASILGLDGGTITLEHARYAHALVKNSVDDVKYLVKKAYANSAEAGEKEVIAAGKETLLRNTKGSGLPPSKARELVSKPKRWRDMQQGNHKRDYFQELIETLLESGELKIEKTQRRERYVSQSVI